MRLPVLVNSQFCALDNCKRRRLIAAIRNA